MKSQFQRTSKMHKLQHTTNLKDTDHAFFKYQMPKKYIFKVPHA